MTQNHEKPLAPKYSSARYMNAYERAHARQHMEQAMAIADWSVRTWEGARAALNRIGNLVRGAFASHRQRVTGAVSHPE